MKEKVFAYILRSDGSSDLLLAFAHKDLPEVPLQVPGGTVKKGEKPMEALKREVREESGLTDLKEIEELGEAQIYDDGRDEGYHGYFYRCRTDHPLSGWEHEVEGSGEDRGLIFDYQWLTPQEALLVHDYYFHVYMRPEYLPTLFTEESLLGLSNKKISLMPHTELWEKEFDKEKEELKRRLDDVEIEHVGSTVIPWVPAKPIIDIAISAEHPEDEVKRIEDCGYEYKGEMGVKDRYYFVKGPEENRTHHIHMFKKGNQKYGDHILFRDYLIDNRVLAERYGKLKLQLWREYHDERERYTEAKSDLINRILYKAKSEDQ